MYKEGKKKRNIKFETDIETEKNRNKNKAESQRQDYIQKKEEVKKQNIRNFLDLRNRKFLTDQEQQQQQPKYIKNYMSDDQVIMQSKRVRESSYGQQYLRKYLRKNSDSQIQHCTIKIQLKLNKQQQQNYQ